MDRILPPQRIVEMRLSAHPAPPDAALTRRRSFNLVAVVCALILSGSELASQPGGTVAGIVTAANKMAIAQARVRVMGTALTTVTRVDGGFEFAQVPAGRQTLEITMLGYVPKVTALVIAPGETLAVNLVLEPLALETVTVTADANSFAGKGGFEERKARGTGRYFTRDDIKLMQARQVTDVLRRVPGMQIQFGDASFGGGTQRARAGRSASGSSSHPCVMTYYLNGSPFPLPADASINQYVATDDLAAIEVYTGSSQLPPEFNSSLYSARCGVVAIWTRGSLDAKASH
jgi:hypothetical protein